MGNPISDIPNQITYLDVFVRLLAALIAGGLIGGERQFRNKHAGIRTYSLICMASAFITIIAIKSIYLLGTKDTSYVSIAILISMGFLGGGMIYRIKEQDIVIRGLTSAAALLMVAVIGIGFGEGLFIEAGLATLMSFIVLILLRFIEFHIGLKKDFVKDKKSNN